MYSWQGLPKSLEALCINTYNRGASQNRTGDTWIFSTMLYTEYQALTGISDQIETISVSQFVPVCPVMPIRTVSRFKDVRLTFISIVQIKL